MPDTPSVLLLHGNDEFAIAAAIENLAAASGGPSEAVMNLSRFDGRTGLDFEALHTAVNAIPFLASRRVVVLAHPSAGFPSPEGRKKFITLLDRVPPTTTLVLVEHEVLQPDQWLVKWARRAGPLAEVHAYSLPKRRDMPGWIVQETRKQGGRIEPAAAARLAEMTGEDTRLAAQEISKLLTYVNVTRPITAKDVEAAGIASFQSSIFELVDALGTGEARKAQKALHRLLDDEDPFELWGMVVRQFRLLLQAREMLDERATALEVQNALGLHEFVAQKVVNQARRFSMSALETIYHQLLEIDEGAKTSQVPLDLALETFIVELTNNSVYNNAS